MSDVRDELIKIIREEVGHMFNADRIAETIANSILGKYEILEKGNCCGECYYSEGCKTVNRNWNNNTVCSCFANK